MDMTHQLDRWLYRGKRPQGVARVLNRAWATLAGAGLAPARMATLEVKGSRTGRTISLPVVVATHQGERYLVSMLGANTSWVRNVRAAGGRAVLRRGRPEPIELIEVSGDPVERGEILRTYLNAAPGARAHIPVDRKAPIEQLSAVAAEIPIFRIASPRA